MGRYSPTVQPMSPLHVLAGGIDAADEGRTRKRERKKRDREDSIREALTALELDRAGVREGTAPTRDVEPERDIFRGEGIGMQRGQTDELALAGGLGLQRRPEPQIVHLPGEFIRGVGFTEKALTDQDLVEATRRRNDPGPRQQEDPRFRQLNDEYFIDQEGTPEARAAAAEQDRATRVMRALEGMGATPEELNLVGADDSFSDDVLGRIDERSKPKEEPTIRVQGRDFPDTEEGRNAALAWRESLAEAARSPDATGDGTRITGEVTRRALATAAARELARIRESVREAGPAKTYEGGEIREQVMNTLSLFGFESVEELEREMRTLRMQGAGGGASPAGDTALSDEELDRLILENPDLSDEEILELARGGG